MQAMGPKAVSIQSQTGDIETPTDHGENGRNGVLLRGVCWEFCMQNSFPESTELNGSVELP